MKFYALFNTQTKAFISFTNDISLFPKNTFLIKEFDLSEFETDGEEFNLGRYRWEGDYDNGHFIDLFAEKKAVVTEDEMDEKYYGLFFRKFRLEEVIFALVSQLHNHPMKDWLVKLEQKRGKEIEFYRESPNHIYQTKEDIKNQFKKSYNVDK